MVTPGIGYGRVCSEKLDEKLRATECRAAASAQPPSTAPANRVRPRRDSDEARVDEPGGTLLRNAPTASVDIQIIGRQAHPPTGLNGWVGFQKEADRESPWLPDHRGFPSMQTVPIERQLRAH